MWRNLQRHEVIVSGGEVNWLIDGVCGDRLPAIDLGQFAVLNCFFRVGGSRAQPI
jgi:hypothetical protein